MIGRIRAAGALALADCATAAELRAAAAAGAQIVATTLCGYTEETAGTPLPALGLLAAGRSSGAFTILEGGVSDPAQLRAAFAAGADAVVIGTAITNVDARVRAFVAPPVG